MSKAVILDSYTAVSAKLSLAGLEKHFDEVEIFERTLPSETIEKIGDAEFIFINRTPITREVIEHCPHLKYIGLFATGYNQVDLEACRQHGVVVCNVPGYSGASVAQLTFSLILHFSFLIDKHNSSVHSGDWGYDPDIFELAGQTLGLIGFGDIGKRVAAIAESFNMNLLVYSRTKYPEYESERLHFADFDSVLANSDIISLHLPLFPETEKLIDETAIAKMKDGAILINTARGGIIDEYAVANALNSGKLKGAGVDVVTVEPITADNPLLKAKNCVITPHIAWATTQARARLIDVVISNVEAFLSGSPQNNVAE